MDADERKLKVLFLEHYRHIHERIMILLERKATFEKELCSLSAVQYDAVKVQGSKESDLSSKMIKYIDVTEDIDYELDTLKNKAKYIRQKIRTITDPRQLSLIELRYIDGLSRKEVKSVMNIGSFSDLDNQTNAALAILNIDKDDLIKIG